MRHHQPPNIVMIVLDTHRRDRLSLYGYDRPTSPNLDHFAAQATVFDNGISAAQWTIPSHTSMFTGEYPTTHQMLQVHGRLDERFDTVASLLHRNGYETTGFCNNPLVGVLNNGLKRGFKTFYNYCGAVPSVPRRSTRLPRPLDLVWEKYTQLLRKYSYPIQNAFAHSDFLFRMSMHPFFVPLWSKMAHFKGDTASSIRDVHQFLQEKEQRAKPQFVFLNLMETHMPYTPPDQFIDKFAPYFREMREARDIIRQYNVEAYRWLLPLEAELETLEYKVLSDMYDVEVNYQDHLLAPLLEYLSQVENTLTIIVADHGEGLGEHHFMGHSFVTYQELVHVPLIIKFPEALGQAQRVAENVSTRRIFHTILHASQTQLNETAYRPAVGVAELSLVQTVASRQDPEQGCVFVEAYPPSSIVTILEKHAPQAIDRFHCTTNRWAVYKDEHKLVRIAGVHDELFDLILNPHEDKNLIDQKTEQAKKLRARLNAFVSQAIARQPDSWQQHQSLNLDDEDVLKQLRALGYIE
jgi:uncharacterized sulfatase